MLSFVILLPLLMIGLTVTSLVPTVYWIGDDDHVQSLWRACTRGSEQNCTKINDISSLTNSSNYHNVEMVEISGATVLQFGCVLFSAMLLVCFLCQMRCGSYVSGLLTFCASLLGLVLYVAYSQKYFSQLRYLTGFWLAVCGLLVSIFSFFAACEVRRREVASLPCRKTVNKREYDSM